jgi:hypothetical protein
MQHWMVICYGHLGQPIGPIFKGQGVHKKILDSLTLEDKTDRFSNHHSTVHNITEEWRPDVCVLLFTVHTIHM